MEAVEQVWIGVTCWQTMMVCGSTSTCSSSLGSTVTIPIIVWLPCFTFSPWAMAAEYNVGGHGRRRAISPAWSWNSYAWEIVLTITEKVSLYRGVCVLVSSIILNHHMCLKRTKKKKKIYLPVLDRTIAESKKKHEEKQLKAQQLRDKLREEKTLKLQKLLERVSELYKVDRNDFTEPWSNPSPIWLSLRGFVNTLLDRITNYFNSLQSYPGQLAEDCYERDPMAKVNSLSWSLFLFLRPCQD